MSNLISYGITVILVYYFAYFAARVLSKKAISEMNAYEMVGVIIMATVAAEPLVTKITAQAFFGVALLTLLTFLTAKISMRNKLTRYFEHTPSIVVRAGRIEWKALKANSMSVNMFYGLMRQKGYTKVGDLEYVILEPQGKLSVIPKSEKRPLQPADMQITPPYDGLGYPVIIDGRVVQGALEFVNQTEDWLLAQLKQQGIMEPGDVVLAELDAYGHLLVSKKDPD